MHDPYHSTAYAMAASGPDHPTSKSAPSARRIPEIRIVLGGVGLCFVTLLVVGLTMNLMRNGYGVGDSSASMGDGEGSDPEHVDDTMCLSASPDTYLGDGECRRANGQYALRFITFAWTTADQCREKCCEYSEWCLAAEFFDLWSQCSLVTDRETFLAAGNTIQHNRWKGEQEIDGVSYRMYCGAGGLDCTVGGAPFEGGSLSLRSMYKCWLRPSARSSKRCLAERNDTYIGEGECRKESGGYPLVFSLAFSHSDWCREKCCQYEWCLAVEFGGRHSECHLVTDLETFQAANYTLQSSESGARQVIDGQYYIAYCNDGGDCTAESTEFGSGSFSPRAGFQCWVK